MKLRQYNAGGHTESNSQVAELHYDDGRVVQISGAEASDEVRGKHILIRVWPANGTNEYGGGNLPSLSVCLRPDGGGWRIEEFDFRAAWEAA